ncbi:hypothetical protein APY03_7537 [Variovorax sp. WDL1]|nr:hypothetical protein APY03_7537 [Variovorax sp. WDL1]
MCGVAHGALIVRDLLVQQTGVALPGKIGGPARAPPRRHVKPIAAARESIIAPAAMILAVASAS